MPRTPAQRSIRDARSLAQKLYSQCRDSTNSFKTLAQPLRRLRNLLEDYEELAVDRESQWTTTPRFVLQLDACTSLLQELELTLQSYRCSTHKWQDVQQQTITRLLESITTRTDNLEGLHEAILDPPKETEQPMSAPVPAVVLELEVEDAPVLAECGGDTFMIVAAPVEPEIQEYDLGKSRRFSWEADDGNAHEEQLMAIKEEGKVRTIDALTSETADEGFMEPKELVEASHSDETRLDPTLQTHTIDEPNTTYTLNDGAKALDHMPEPDAPAIEVAHVSATQDAQDVQQVPANEAEAPVKATKNAQDANDELLTAPGGQEAERPDPGNDGMHQDGSSNPVGITEHHQDTSLEDNWDHEPVDLTNAKTLTFQQISSAPVIDTSTAPPQQSSDLRQDFAQTAASTRAYADEPENEPSSATIGPRATSPEQATVIENTTVPLEAIGASSLDETTEFEPTNAASADDTSLTAQAAKDEWRTLSVGSSIFQSPFAIFDPLSVDIESASSFLLSPAEPAPKSRASSVSHTLRISPPTSIERKESEQATSEDPNASDPFADPVKNQELDIEGQSSRNVSQEIKISEQTTIPMTIMTAAPPSPPRPLTEEAAGLGITFSPVSFEPSLDSPQDRDTFTKPNTPITSQKADIPTIIMDLARADSIHASTTIRPSSENLTGPLSPIDELLASFHEDEDALAAGDSSKQHHKSKWLSLRPSSAPIKSPTSNVARSKFSLQDQLRRVSFRTKTAASEPMKPEAKSSLESSPEVGNEVDHDTPSTTELNTPLASPLISAPTSPMSAQDKDLPAIPPPPPIRAPPQVPEAKVELGMFPAPPMPPPKKYRIVNPSPPSVYSTVSEDLYSSSRPSSPTRLIPTEPVPKIQIQPDQRSVSPVESHGSGEEQAVQNPFADEAAPTLPPRQSISPNIEQRYFRIELEEPEHNRGRRMSSSALRHDTDRSASISAASSLHESERRPHTAVVSPASTAYSIDDERLDRLCKCWRSQRWSQAESYLRGHLDAMLDQSNTDSARRVMHLLGVCASYEGQWSKALGYFLAATHAPVKSVEMLDHGDCAAFYWLGDTYALLNRRTEAILAYSIALQIYSRRAGAPAGHIKLLKEEISALLAEATPLELMASWEKMKKSTKQATDSIMDRAVLDPAIITSCLEAAAQCRTNGRAVTQVCNRASALSELEGSSATATAYLGARLTPQSFKRGNPWPEAYDATFVASNVAAGRLCDRPTDMLAALVTQPVFKVARNGPSGASRLDCFTCNHLDWLIVAVRQCLSFLEMRWDEFANDKATLFMCRFAVYSRNVVAAHYFGISIFRQTMRAGYGVEVCPTGVESARILAVSPEYVNGVHGACEKRLRKLVKDYLAHAYKLWLKDGKKAVSDSLLPTTSVSVREQAAGLLATSSLMSIAPVMPSRPLYA